MQRGFGGRKYEKILAAQAKTPTEKDSIDRLYETDDAGESDNPPQMHMFNTHQKG